MRFIVGFWAGATDVQRTVDKGFTTLKVKSI